MSEKNVYRVFVTDTHVIALSCLQWNNFSYVDPYVPLKKQKVNKQFTKKPVLL